MNIINMRLELNFTSRCVRAFLTLKWPQLIVNCFDMSSKVFILSGCIRALVTLVWPNIIMNAIHMKGKVSLVLRRISTFSTLELLPLIISHHYLLSNFLAHILETSH